MSSRTSEKRQFHATVLLSVIIFLLIAILGVLLAPAAHAQSVPPMIVLTPDTVTGELRAKVNSNIDDARVVRVCMFRIDQNSPDPLAEVACADMASGRAPTAEEAGPSGVGMIYEIPFSSVFVAGQDQLFVARNIADVGGGIEISSLDSLNSALIPQAVGQPVFIYLGPSS